MRRSLSATCVVAVTIISITGCTVGFQSKQLSFVKGLFEQKGPQPKKNWVVRWESNVYYVYAINYDGGTFFGNEDEISVSFDGWQITDFSMVGTREDEGFMIKASRDQRDTISIEYFGLNGELLRADRCQLWYRVESFGWQQDCLSGHSSNVAYSNKIKLNQDGLLTSLSFLVLPQTGPMEIELL